MSENIVIKNAHTHNLKNISLTIPKNKLVVITGVSGSGKSSLAFDTLYAEGQRQYLESLSTYARMIVSEISNETKVDEIRGLSPTIAIHQKTVSNNPRSTVGTITEIYDYYRLLYTSIGKQHCPDHPEVLLKKDTIRNIVQSITLRGAEKKFHITVPFIFNVEVGEDLAKMITDMGFVRYEYNNHIYSVADNPPEGKINPKNVQIIIDRLVSKVGEEQKNYETRLKDSLSLAYKKWEGSLSIHFLETDEILLFREHPSCPICDYSLQDLSISNFSFNSHYGACETCHGLWSRMTFLEENIINFSLSLAEWAILPWTAHPYYTAILETMCKKHKIDMLKPYSDLKIEDREKILFWVSDVFELSYVSKFEKEKIHHAKFEWLIPNLERRLVEWDAASDTYLKRISQYVTEIQCNSCDGFRLKKSFLSVLVTWVHIGQLSSLSVREAYDFFTTLVLSESEKKIAETILKNITERLEFLIGVWLDYVTLDRRANTLSWGESQRIRLATQIWTRLEGIIYVLDEPSIGLHPRDNDMLIGNLKKLSEIGNTVIVVEHDEDIMKESDYIIDIWPRAGVHGWEIVFQWTYNEILQNTHSETGKYLRWDLRVHLPKNSRKPSGFIRIEQASENNLQNVTVKIPLGMLVVVTGVSGSWKSSLIMDTLANATMKYFHGSAVAVWKHTKIEGLDNIDKAIIIDQSPIGKTPHSNIATYTWVFTFIREAFAASLEAQKRWYGPWRFSFNTKWWRCETCEGSWVKKIEMHFLPDVYIECDQCEWTRYNPETLEVRFKGKHIAEVLAMTVEESRDFFTAFPRIKKILDVLYDVWLWYITLWQSAPTLSWWEAQRIKLAFDLAKRSTSKTLYILDEPTTGLHFSDVQKLLDILDKLVEKGNSVLVIEHNLDVIALADYIIDIWPEWGKRWWNLLYSGKVPGILETDCHTGRSLARYLQWKKEPSNS